MELFPDGMPVRLRSRACDLFLYADEDGVGVSLSPLRASPRTSWEVRHVERHGAAYVLLQSTADGRYLDISPDPAPPGARGLRVVQSEMLGIVWSARLAGDGGSDVLVRHSIHGLGLLCPLGCGAGVGVRQRVNGRSSLLPRWSVEPAPVAPPPPVIPPSPAMEKGRGSAYQNGLVLSGAPRAQARGRRGAKGKVWAPVLGVTGASRGPFWVPLVDARSRHAGYMAHHAVVGLPDVARGGELEARLPDLGGGDLGGGGMIVVLAADDVVRLAAPASLWQKLRGRVGPGQRHSASPRAAVFLPLCLEGGGPAAGGERELEPEPEVEAPAQTLVVQAMVSQLDKLHQGMETRHHSIRDLVGRLREIEILVRTGSYDSDTPIRKAVEELEEDVARIVDSYNAMKMQAEELSAAIAGEGVTPAAPPAVLRESLEDAVTPSIRRRLLRRQLLREGKGPSEHRTLGITQMNLQTMGIQALVDQWTKGYETPPE